MRRPLLLIFCLLVFSLACNLTRNPAGPTPLPPTFTPDYTATAIAQVPTATPSPEPSPTATATQTFTPEPSPTPTMTLTPLPTSTPLATPFFASDQVSFVPILGTISEGLDQAWVAFTLTDQQVSIEEPSDDSQAAEPVQRLYLARPDTGQRILVMELPAETDNRIYWSPTGLHLAYFLQSDDPQTSGLYLLNLQSGRLIRVYGSQTLQPRQITGHQPLWSPDGTRLAFVLPTAYATDIFIINADGSGFMNVTTNENYDFWPAWSPDGKRLAFLSDRDTCATWIPNQPNTCDTPDASAPRMGKLYVFNLETGRLDKASDDILNAPPIWANDNLVSVSLGSADIFNETSELRVYDVAAGSTWLLSPPESGLYGLPSWSSDAQMVVFQRISNVAQVVLADRYGTLINLTNSYPFIRFGISIAWSPTREYIAVAGKNGQCPYGLLIFDSNFNLVNQPPENLLACNVAYDSTGQYVAYEGIQLARGTDGRVDIYASLANGTSPRNLTRNLDGVLYMLGWVGPTFK